MKKLPSFFLLLLGLLLFSVSWAQGPAAPAVADVFVTGKVVNENQQAVPFAAVALYRQQDSALLVGGASDEFGIFRLKAEVNGKYFLKVNFLSYNEKLVSGISTGSGSVNLGMIGLTAGSLALDEVEIVAEKSEMELSLDKRVFNVGKDLRNVGSNASEILENVPSVDVDVDGNVSLRGSGNVRILIDGKPSSITGASVADALRQLQGDLIERVEVITNPSARYDAEGEVGIINIVLKKDKSRKGWSGSITTTAGYPENFGASFNVNYRKKKINYFLNAGTSYRRNPGSGYSLQEFTEPDTAFYYRRDREHIRKDLGGNARFGVDYSFNKYNSLTASVLYGFSDGDNNTRLVYEDFAVNDALVQTVIREDDEIELEENRELRLSYRKTFPQKDREWVTDFNWNDSDDRENSNILEENDRPDIPLLQQRVSNAEDEMNYLFQSDYVHPFSKTGRFETGVKSTYRFLVNDYLVEELNDGTWNALPDFNNNFEYTELIYAGYAMAGEKFGALSVQAGLRYEYSDITTELTDTRIRNRRTYPGWFPSAFMSYELSEKQSVQLSYSRRLSRPGFRQLLPFFGFADARSFYSGNPDLDPEYTNSFEINYLINGDKGSLLVSGYFRHRTDLRQRITQQADSLGFVRSFPINLGEQDAYGFEGNFSYTLTDWWRLNVSYDFYRAVTSGTYEGQSFAADALTMSTNGRSRWTIGEKMGVQLSFRYRAPLETTQGRRLALYTCDLGASREVFNGRGTVSFSARDLFNTRVRRSITRDIGYYAESEFQWRSRVFRISLNYRINQKKRREGRESGRGGFDGEGEG